MKKEYDFSEGIRGKFYRPDAELNMPIYLEPEVAKFVERIASETKTNRSEVVNSLLKKDKEIIELGR